jgi:galactose-1-phosphate uridylyltransferase
VVKKGLSEQEYLKLYPDLSTFSRMVNEMKETGETAERYMSLVCREILRNVAVYKDDEKGKAGLSQFIKEVSL